MENIKIYMKLYMPKYIWLSIGHAINYYNRLRIWPILLWHVRGVSVLDQIKLLWAAICAPIICLKDLANWQDPRVLSDCKVLVKNIGIFNVRKNSDDLYHIYPKRERYILDYHFNNLKNGDIYIDAGANIGFYTILASKLVGVSGKIIAIELIPENMEILKINCQLNNIDNVIFISNALADTVNKIVKASVYAGHFGQSSLNLHGVLSGESFVEVKTITVDAIISSLNLSHVNLIKMDIEGAEILAIEGCIKSFKKITSIIYEVLSAADKVNITSNLITNGFNVSDLDSRNRLAFRHF